MSIIPADICTFCVLRRKFIFIFLFFVYFNCSELEFGVWIVCFSFYLFLSTNQLLGKFSRCAIMIGHVVPCCWQSYRGFPRVIISHVVNMSYQAFSIQWAPVCFEEEWLQWLALITNYSLERGKRPRYYSVGAHRDYWVMIPQVLQVLLATC